MKKASFALVVFVIACLGGQAFAQTIHRDQLKNFWGSISANLGRKSGTVLTRGFEEWSLSQIDYYGKDPGRVDYRKGGEFPVYVAFQWLRAPAYAVPNRNIVVAALQDVFGHERQNHILSFWEANGDSLKFAFFDSKVRMGSVGNLTVREAKMVSENDLLVVTEHYVVDHGVGGRLDFAVFNVATHDVDHLYSGVYWTEANSTTGDTLRYELIESEGRVDARMIRQNLSFSLVEAESGLRRVRKVTQTDTTIVPLVSAVDVR